MRSVVLVSLCIGVVLASTGCNANAPDTAPTANPPITHLSNEPKEAAQDVHVDELIATGWKAGDLYAGGIILNPLKAALAAPDASKPSQSAVYAAARTIEATSLTTAYSATALRSWTNPSPAVAGVTLFTVPKDNTIDALPKDDSGVVLVKIRFNNEGNGTAAYVTVMKISGKNLPPLIGAVKTAYGTAGPAQRIGLSGMEARAGWAFGFIGWNELVTSSS